MRPELPFLLAGVVAVLGATIRDKKFPGGDQIATVVIGTVVLVLVSSATAETRIAPLVRAFGMLILLAAVITAVNVTLNKKKVLL